MSFRLEYGCSSESYISGMVARWVHFLRFLQNNKCIDAIQVACFTVFEFTPSFSSLHLHIASNCMLEPGSKGCHNMNTCDMQLRSIPVAKLNLNVLPCRSNCIIME